MGLLFLTPAFGDMPEAVGVVHSVFRSAVNLRLRIDAGQRLFTLCAEGCPRLPDAACVPRDWLARLRMDEPVRLCMRTPGLLIGGRALPLTRSPWQGIIPRQAGFFHMSALRRACAGLQDGFSRLPEAWRLAAFSAIRSGDGRYLGLGGGLTPAFDDACIGAMAVRRALGVPSAFRLPDLSRTTDVSARYLALASEGHFGEPLCDAVAALCGHGDITAAIARLRAVGATSGADMLRGMLLAAEAAQAAKA
jgi:hypothetical protein